MTETGTLTLADFLLARIAEDERTAREIRPEESPYSRDRSELGAADEKYAAVTISSGRVLAECEAKRRIVAEHGSDTYGEYVDGQLVDIDELYCVTCGPSANMGRELPWPCPTLRALAAVYADHPDFREEWRP